MAFSARRAVVPVCRYPVLAALSAFHLHSNHRVNPLGVAAPKKVQGFHLLLPMASADEHRLSAPVGQFTAWHPEAQHMGNAVNHTARVDGGRR